MRKTMIIPTYWCRRTGELWREGDAVYDHPTPVDQEGTLERTLLSMKQFHEKDFKLVILICPPRRRWRRKPTGRCSASRAEHS